MKRTLIQCSLICLVWAAGCSSDDNNGSSDTGLPGADAAQQSDQGTSAADSGNNGGTDTGTQTDAGGNGTADMSTTNDMSASQDMSSSADTGTDTGSPADMGSTTDPYAGRPTGQCTENADCPDGPQGRMCSRSLPGGACLGCGTDDHCPSGAICQFGTCIAECDVDDDCAPGLRCLGSGRCAALPCTDTCDVSLFGCSDSGQCERIDCSADPNVCPASTTCTAGLCIEDRALN